MSDRQICFAQTFPVENASAEAVSEMGHNMTYDLTTSRIVFRFIVDMISQDGLNRRTPSPNCWNSCRALAICTDV